MSLFDKHANQFIDLSIDMFCIASIDGYFLELNEIWEEKLGYTISELKSRPYIEFVYPEDTFATSGEQKNLEDGKRVLSFSNRYIHKNGSLVWLNWRSFVDQESGLIFAIATDITQTKEKEALSDIMSQIANIGSWRVNVEKGTCYWSEMTYKIHEVEVDTPIALEDGINYYIEEHRPIIQKCVEEGVEKNKAWDVELQICTGKGKKKWVRALGRPIIVGGKLIRLEGIFQDIDERKKKEVELFDSYEQLKKYELAVDQHSIVAKTKPNGEITFVNSNFCKISEYSKEELIGKDHRIINSGHHSKEFFQGMWTNLLSGKKWRGEILNKSKSGKVYWVDTSITPILDENGNVKEFIAIRNDITKQKEAVTKLHEQRIISMNNSKLASLGEMAAGIAHEINNPLTIIAGGANILEKKIDNEKLKEKASVIIRNVERMSKIVKSLRSLARNSSADDFQDVSLDSILEELHALSFERFKTYGVSLNFDSQENAIISCRKSEILQVLVNIFNNAFDAIKKDEDKWVRLSTKKDSKNIIISISDSGQGVQAEHLSKIFDPFYTTKDVGQGTGLGLSISKTIISNHNGKIYYDNKDGTSKFIINLPFK